MSRRRESPAASIPPEILITAFIQPEILVTIEEARRLRPDLPPGIHGPDKQARLYRRRRYWALRQPGSNAVPPTNQPLDWIRAS
jgi:hypothetical protein